jgi:hypothetical protein
VTEPHTPAETAPPLDVLQRHFLTILPHIVGHGRIYFRGVRCPHRKEDRIAEMVGLAWKWFLAMASRGKDGRDFPRAIAAYAARAVHCGRRVWRQERANEVLSPVAQKRHDFMVGTLPNFETLESNPLLEALADNTVSPVPDQAAFRLDFPRWLGRLGERNRQVAEDLMVGERTLDVADKHGLCPGRISQLRRELHRDWLLFHGEAAV